MLKNVPFLCSRETECWLCDNSLWEEVPTCFVRGTSVQSSRAAAAISLQLCLEL